ncbi:MYXO-CTERM sorting domain-containing protein [Myxococcaceae bacterium GXIMD 01537]
MSLLLGVLLWGTTALAQDPDEYPSLGFRMMNSSQNPFPLYVDGRNLNGTTTPGGIDISLVTQAVQNAAKTWEDVACASTDFDVKGTSTSAPDPTDRTNIAAIWVTRVDDPLYENALASGLSPSAALPLSYAGALYQCDIVLNAVDYRWSALQLTTPIQPGYMDLESAILRELGHCQGLADVFHPADAVMSFELLPGQRKRVLTQHDTDHLCALSPQAGAVGSPCTTTCTNGLACVSTTAPDGVAVKVCAKGCTGNTPGECPDPYVCRTSAAVAGFTSACLPPTTAVTQVGKACTTATVATCGSGFAVCREPVDQPSNQVPAWTGGYCTQSCESTGCPSGSRCAAPGPQVGTEKVCLQTCRPGTGDCRAGYACALRPEGHVCVPECHVDADCQVNGGSAASVCRTCDNSCVPRVEGGRAVGQPCEAAAECAQGLVCLRYIQNEGSGVCAQPCSTALCGCPFGTTCQPVGNKGERLCVADCTHTSCPQGTLCTPNNDGKVCLPPSACESAGDCPKGFGCSLTGKCYDPSLLNADAGTCSLCGADGGGTPPPPPPPPTDGGTDGPSGPGGCGCEGAPTSAVAFFAALALLLVVRRNRTWPRP